MTQRKKQVIKGRSPAGMQAKEGGDAVYGDCRWRSGLLLSGVQGSSQAACESRRRNPDSR